MNTDTQTEQTQGAGSAPTLKSQQALAIMSKLHPILFSAPMVRAILAGNKTQTRRIVKPQKCRELGCEMAACEIAGEVNYGDFRNSRIKPGERLWVREAWGYLGGEIKYPEGKSKSVVQYHADGARREILHASPDEMIQSMPQQNLVYPQGFDDLPDWQQREKYHELLNDWWRQKQKIVSIHMPRWASRIELEVTAVRIERLQDISEADSEAEGVNFIRACQDADETLTAKQLFAALWESINGPKSWDANPFVWVYEFKAVNNGR
jgi:hypothetical protein